MVFAVIREIRHGVSMLLDLVADDVSRGYAERHGVAPRFRSGPMRSPIAAQVPRDSSQVPLHHADSRRRRPREARNRMASTPTRELRCRRKIFLSRHPKDGHTEVERCKRANHSQEWDAKLQDLRGRLSCHRIDSVCGLPGAPQAFSLAEGRHVRCVQHREVGQCCRN